MHTTAIGVNLLPELDECKAYDLYCPRFGGPAGVPNYYRTSCAERRKPENIDAYCKRCGGHPEKLKIADTGGRFRHLILAAHADQPTATARQLASACGCSARTVYSVLTAAGVSLRSASRTCAFCGKPITPRPGEAKSRYEQRRTCSAKCTRELRKKNRMTPEVVDDLLKLHAAEPELNHGQLAKRLDRSRAWVSSALRRYDPQAAAEPRRFGPKPKPVPDKYCRWCGKKLVRREDESNSNFRRRAYCDQHCFSQDRKGK